MGSFTFLIFVTPNLLFLMSSYILYYLCFRVLCWVLVKGRSNLSGLLITNDDVMRSVWQQTVAYSIQEKNFLSSLLLYYTHRCVWMKISKKRSLLPIPSPSSSSQYIQIWLLYSPATDLGLGKAPGRKKAAATAVYAALYKVLYVYYHQLKAA